MERLVREEKKTVDTYTYTINHFGIGSEPGLCDAGLVFIEFVNGKFSKACFKFRGQYDRAQWKVLGAIANKITELEGEYYGGYAD